MSTGRRLIRRCEYGPRRCKMGGLASQTGRHLDRSCGFQAHRNRHLESGCSRGLLLIYERRELLEPLPTGKTARTPREVPSRAEPPIARDGTEDTRRRILIQELI